MVEFSTEEFEDSPSDRDLNAGDKNIKNKVYGRNIILITVT